MAERLITGGQRLAVFDIRPKAVEPLVSMGARWASSVGELVDRCEIVVVSLPDLSTVREVLLRSGEFRSGRNVKIVVNTSTVGPTLAVGRLCRTTVLRSWTAPSVAGQPSHVRVRCR